MEKQCIWFLVLLFCSLFLVGSSGQNVDDNYWLQRRQEAIFRSNDAYRSDFYNVTNFLNARARKMLENEETSDDSRRMLASRKHDSSCEITNPIDACWRCHHNWVRHRTQLAKCALGFGKNTTGGQGGQVYVVTDPSDEDAVNPKPGTLRHAVIQDEPLWITFKKSMNIMLKQELIMNSHKTIDGRGAQVVIEHGPGITIPYVYNIIIHGIQFRNIVSGPGGLIRDSTNHYGHRNASNGNAISIYGSQRIWIDHCSFANCFQKFTEVLDGSTAITISNCRMSSQDEVFAFGAQDKYELDKKMQITVAYSHFGENLVKNMPRCSNGFCHVVNNDYTAWKGHVITGRANVTIMSQGNRYMAPDHPKHKQITNRTGVSYINSGTWGQERDIMLNGAYFEPSGRLLHNPHKQHKLRAMPGIMASVMTRYAGPLKCLFNTPC